LRKLDKVFRLERFQIQVPEDLNGTVRADHLVKTNLPGLSRRVREQLFVNQAVWINGRPVTKGYKPFRGDLLEIEIPAPLDPYPIPDPTLQLSVVFEDQDLLIIEKPGLVPTHPLSPFETGTLANALTASRPQVIGVGNKPLEPGLVHRLDQGTSGLLAVALREQSWQQMKKDLTFERWKKTYWALVEGILKKEGAVSLPLAHDPGDDQKMKVTLSPGDKRRGRVYKALSLIRPQKFFKNHTLVEIRLITGVTHQIRVHLSSCGHPVAGDTLYGAMAPQEIGLPPGRFFLHAGRLTLPHPITRERKTFSIPFPEDLRQVLYQLTV
jgi:23S rRNA pseudouridine1911/1915/1917 synthase